MEEIALSSRLSSHTHGRVLGFLLVLNGEAELEKCRPGSQRAEELRIQYSNGRSWWSNGRELEIERESRNKVARMGACRLLRGSYVDLEEEERRGRPAFDWKIGSIVPGAAIGEHRRHGRAYVRVVASGVD